MSYVRSAQNNKSVTCSFVRNSFYFVLCAKFAGRSAFKVKKNDHFLVTQMVIFSLCFWAVERMPYIRIA